MREVASISGRKGHAPTIWSVRMRASRGGLHISGAEGLYEEGKISPALEHYARRALEHSRGTPDRVVISIERLKEKPKAVVALPLCTLKCESPREARTLSGKILRAAGVSEDAIQYAYRVLSSRTAMRGAALVSARDGRRLDPDLSRGVRASRMGMEDSMFRALGRRLSRLGLNNRTVKEALVLASKVASSKGIIAEICASDDPDYTTGYVSTRRFGYVRIPNIKRAGSRRGGRAFFVEDGADVQSITDYLEKKPVMVTRLSAFRGTRTIDEIISS